MYILFSPNEGGGMKSIIFIIMITSSFTIFANELGHKNQLKFESVVRHCMGDNLENYHSQAALKACPKSLIEKQSESITRISRQWGNQICPMYETSRIISIYNCLN